LTKPGRSNDHTLVLFYKFPKPGFGKQRLAASIGAEAAHKIGLKLLDCAFEDMRDWKGNLVVAPANVDSANASEEFLTATFAERDYGCIPQGDGNLGERLNRVDATLRRQGHTHVHYIGSDAPALSPAVYERAQERLEHTDYVLADSRDGGVTLMSASKAWPDMIDLPWSTERLGGALAGLCGVAGSTVERFDGLYDIDEIADLKDVRRDLANDSRPARIALMETIDLLLTEVVSARSDV
jgi:glycosyltransferase A (GT-A) superfamily protein (DUF2064 family)